MNMDTTPDTYAEGNRVAATNSPRLGDNGASGLTLAA